jgi:transposase
MLFIGLDWSRDKHDFAFLSADGDVLMRDRFKHSASGFIKFVQAVSEYEPEPTEVHLVVELHDGALMAWLLGQEYNVYGLNPKSADRARDCYAPSGSKDDSLDAYVLGDWGRMHYREMRPITSLSELTEQLRGWVRLRARLVQDKTRACQRLRALLSEWAPGYSKLCNDFNRKWQQDILQQYPLVEDLSKTHGNTLRAWARKHRLREKTFQKIQSVRSAEPMPIPAARREVLRYEILQLAETIARLCSQIKEIENRLDAAIEEHPDRAIFESLPVGGTATIAGLMAAFGQNRELNMHWRERAARWGASPVTVQSGRSRHVKRRCACDQVVHQTLQTFAFQTAFKDDCWASDYYDSKRKAGTSHYTALRCLAQRWVKIINRIWEDRILYQEQIHRENRRRALAA